MLRPSSCFTLLGVEAVERSDWWLWLGKRRMQVRHHPLQTDNNSLYVNSRSDQYSIPIHPCYRSCNPLITPVQFNQSCKYKIWLYSSLILNTGTSGYNLTASRYYTYYCGKVTYRNGSYSTRCFNKHERCFSS